MKGCILSLFDSIPMHENIEKFLQDDFSRELIERFVFARIVCGMHVNCLNRVR